MFLKEKIKSRGIKQTWIAEKVGVSKELLHHYLTGKVSIPENIEFQIRELLK